MSETDNLKHILGIITALRKDAIARGMNELAMAYGWSAIRLGEELIFQLKARKVT
jgi:hypothetical protein